MDYLKLASEYVGRELTGYDVLFNCDTDGVFSIFYWNITDKPQPTIAELEALQPQLDIIENNENIKAQIAELETKLSRANTEVTLNKDSRIKDSSTGQTWLEYYNEQIESLRTQLK